MKADVRENLEYMLDRFDKKDLKLMLEEMTKDEYSEEYKNKAQNYCHTTTTNVNNDEEISNISLIGKMMTESSKQDVEAKKTGFEKRLHIYEIILTVVVLVGIVASIIGIFATNFRWEVIVATIAILFMDIVTLDSLWNDRNNVARR